MNITNTDDMYSTLSKAIEEAFELKRRSEGNEEDDYDEEELTEGQYRKQVTAMYLKEHKGNIVSGILYSFVFVHMIICGIFCIHGLLNLTTQNIPGSIFYYIIWVMAPFGIWIYSTKYDWYNFHNRKMALFTLAIVNATVALICAIYRFTAPIIFTLFAGIPVTKDITPNMIMGLARLASILICVGIGIIFFYVIIKQVTNEMTKERILAFKVLKNIDVRTEKEFSYDMSIVKNLVTGEKYIIKEKDRSLHSVANGVTGTGKTSSCFTCAIADDLRQISYNLNYQKKTIAKWLAQGRVKMKYPMSDVSFDIDNFVPTKEKDATIVEDLKWKAKLAGITAMAPNASFSDEIYGLAKAAGIKKINRLDPTLDATGHLKEGFIGFNPLHISPKLTQMEWVIEVSRKAVMFADVMQAIYSTSGQTNPYFASLNRNITTSVTMLVIITYPRINKGKQPTPETVQMILNDFGKARIYREKLVEMFQKKDENGKPVLSNARPVLTNFQGVLDVIDAELLGDNAQKMFEQSTGLRIIINSFLTNPLIKNILCNENTIDMDEMLANGEVTLVNYALELGADSRAFGLFFLLSFINAVYRRPGTEHTRIPNFFYIDELPVLLHPSMEACFSLFRQYRVAMFVAIQSLSQMEKVQETAFMKDLLLGNCAHHFVFGRVAPAEMRLYQELAGTELKLTIQDGMKESPITSDNPSVMQDHRETVMRDISKYGSDIRNRDFQETTVVSVRDGSPVGVFFGKVAFLPKYRRIRRPAYKIKLDQYEPMVPVYLDDIKQEEYYKNANDVIDSVSTVVSSNTTSVVNENKKEVPAFMAQLKDIEKQKHTNNSEDKETEIEKGINFDNEEDLKIDNSSEDKDDEWFEL